MILHKLLFFRLPYRWAAYGDRPLDGFSHASPHEDGENDNDMDRLEREVSSYAGFKSTPRLETLFTSRRLPRTYLVLLESLLNVSPATRPSCEKVLAAIHLGKVGFTSLFFSPPLAYDFFSSPQFNPVQPKSSISDVLASRNAPVADTTVTSSLVPVLRLPITSSPPSSPTLPQLTPPPSIPASHPTPNSAEKESPHSPVRPRQGRWFAFSQQTSGQMLRAFKSGVLALKIASLCLNKGELPLWAVSMLAGLSIVDSLSENVTLNLGFSVLHVAVLKTWRWRG